MKFDENGRFVEFDFDSPTGQLRKMRRDGSAFVTSGCQNYNLPYFNKGPGGSSYTHSRQPSSKRNSRDKEAKLLTMSYDRCVFFRKIVILWKSLIYSEAGGG
ncbi:MAG: hypothetical protein OEX77_05085 [Candidatus Bathyarchaeota archaeon]|nr:hypothetical protein [Candidatus Bathyarchaeota archaeon]MDH5733600.1 hypothetical protein [Candidatus Bathyarchaeota archaeon]